VPFTADYKVFKKMASFGKQLVDLHLMESNMLEAPVSKFHGEGTNNRIEKVIYDEKNNVFISTITNILTMFRLSCGTIRLAAIKSLKNILATG